LVSCSDDSTVKEWRHDPAAASRARETEFTEQGRWHACIGVDDKDPVAAVPARSSAAVQEPKKLKNGSLDHFFGNAAHRKTLRVKSRHIGSEGDKENTPGCNASPQRVNNGQLKPSAIVIEWPMLRERSAHIATPPQRLKKKAMTIDSYFSKIQQQQ
jgi:hypothetical protein